MENNLIFIKGAVPSLKNSKIKKISDNYEVSITTTITGFKFY